VQSKTKVQDTAQSRDRLMVPKCPEQPRRLPHKYQVQLETCSFPSGKTPLLDSELGQGFITFPGLNLLQ